MDDKKNNEGFSFVKEQIKTKPINKRRLFRRILWILLAAVAFGMVASFTIALMEPVFSGWFYSEEQEEANLPWSGEDEETTPEEDEEVILELNLEAAALQSLMIMLDAICMEANRVVVTVTGVTSTTDWYDATYDSEQEASGIIIGDNEQELLILTDKSAIDEAQTIHVTFVNGESALASVKKYDLNTGLAVISVDLDEISDATMNRIKIATLGNSYTVSQGTMVLALGSPLGVNFTILEGTITSASSTISLWDGNYTVLTTDIIGSASGNGVLVNLDGEVVGLINQSYSSSENQSTIAAISISQLKSIITQLSNGRAIPYLGMKVSTVSESIANTYDLPMGVYVKSVATGSNSPALKAGIQEADVIVAINGEEISTVKQYTDALNDMSPEQTITLTVMRQSGSGYVELKFNLTVGVMQ